MRKIAFLTTLLLVMGGCGGQPELVDEAELPQLREARPVSVMDRPRADLAEQTDPPDNLYPGFAATTETPPTLVGITRGEVDVYQSPGATEPVRRLAATTILGTPTVLTAISQPIDGWLEVMLPGRPNGATGWIQVEEVDLYSVGGRIVIDLSERELNYYAGDSQVLRADVAVGTSRNPTPTGTYFVTDSVTLSSSDTPWGPAALGLSARSETITEFNGGDGIIGIHGTNRPELIGQAVSLGCVRLPNHLITQLHELVPLGTPVEIRA